MYRTSNSECFTFADIMTEAISAVLPWEILHADDSVVTAETEDEQVRNLNQSRVKV